MIKKLRIKLIFAAMISLLAVLLVIMSTISCLYYKKIVDDADETLDILSANDGFFPGMQDSSYMKMDEPLYREKTLQRIKNQNLPPELPFETRYFFAMVGDEGEILSVNVGKIAAIDADTAGEYAAEVWEDGSSRGFANNYRYLVSDTGDDTLILFLDCSRSLDSFRTLLISSIAVSITGSALVLLLLILLSGRIVKPFSENYEKQKRFITDAGHELKTPLTIIDADAEILAMDLGENEWLNDIQGQTRRLSELTNSLILLSRMEEAQSGIQILEFSISDAAEETIQGFQALAKAQDKSLNVVVEPMVSFNGDEKSIRKLISILMDNAVKYTPTDGKIVFTLKHQKNQINISVYNTTEHITKEQTQHLFDRFYRADQSRNSDTGGYGLGLSIAQAIVNSHKGKITASTQDERSLLINVTLPQ